jgi:hypothetical protein
MRTFTCRSTFLYGRASPLSLKGPKLEIFGSRVFTQIRPVWVGDLETRTKNSTFLWFWLEKRHFGLFSAGPNSKFVKFLALFQFTYPYRSDLCENPGLELFMLRALKVSVCFQPGQLKSCRALPSCFSPSILPSMYSTIPWDVLSNLFGVPNCSFRRKKKHDSEEWPCEFPFKNASPEIGNDFVVMQAHSQTERPF